ncbi:hypothetical protein [Streptomyces sp. NBC_00687]|uniref:hypothetical protein n=1 Tax=Streptomyces sp. NBC_00687 TaxID=2975807 RepID=UPI00224E5DB0|nr:hypothetical protein [Streptomyces sp. NBC_00687]MCX4919929.1 hypothetical protein [Streptomyces sp. NBC_00687]
MTDILHAPPRYDADSPLAYLLGLVEPALDVPEEQDQRRDAETTAAYAVHTEYGASLAQVLASDHWTGYPAISDGNQRFEASAVAWLDGGLWLHHTQRITERDGARDVLTLIAPCTCGRAYVDFGFDTEDHLMEILSELKATSGRSPHDEKNPLDCSSITATPLYGTADTWQ